MRLFRCVRWLLPVLMLLVVPAASFAGVSISVTIAPPVLPVYEQPVCSHEGWMWVPGYWAYGDDGYYWVPGEWVPAPYEGALWTPAWWGWDGGHYRFHDGYWGDRVGYYGGINYGYGYMGVGFVGGEWRGGRFAYNTAVMRVDRSVVRNTYVNETIIRSNTIANSRHVAFSGGPNGIRHDPTPVEREAMSGRHTPATSTQLQHVQSARADRTSYAKANGGHPHTLVVARSADEGRTAGEKSAPTRSGAHETIRPGATARTTPTEHASPKSESKRTMTRTTPESRPTVRTTPESHSAKSARPESRTESRTTTARSESRTGGEPRTAPSRTESRPSASKAETRKAETRPESRTAPTEKPRPESHAAAAPRAESRRAPEARAEARPAPRAESRPAPAPRTESRAAPRAESHTAPAPRTESRPAPRTESRPAPAPRTESRPAPRHESRPAPAAHPAPQHASHPAPQPKQEKPKPEPR